MKHADEKQSFSAEALARRQRYSADLDGLFEAYEQMLEKAMADSAHLKSVQEDLSRFQTEAAQLRTAVQMSRAEALRLKATLTQIRKSGSLRLGKAILKPVRGVRRAAKAIRQTGASENKPSNNTPAVPDNPGERSRDLAKQEEHQRAVRREGTAANIIRAVSHAYYVLGDIQEPAKLIREHESVLTSLSARDQRTVNAVLGQDRLWHRDPHIAPRQPNPGYLAERGRVMYCAHSTGHYNSNGYSTRTAELVLGMKNQGMDVLVAARPGYPWDVPADQPKPASQRFTRTISGVEHIFSPGPSWTSQPLDHYWHEASDAYVREAQRARVAAIHSASNHVTALPALVAARRLGIPFSFEVRGLWEITEASEKPSWHESEKYQLAQRLETLVAVNADVVFAITDQVRDELVTRGVKRDKIQLLPNGVDTDRFTPMPPSDRIRRKLGLPNGVPVIGYAGSLVHYEGISDLLSAVGILKEQSVDFRAVIVGDGAELPRLMAQSAALGIEDYVHFTGRVKAEDVPEYLSIFDVMPCPRVRLPVTELVSPLKPLEAMSAGKAMVLTDLGPLREFAGESQERALLAEPSDPGSLAEALRRLLTDQQLRQEMGRRARLWTIRSRQWRSIGNVVTQKLETVMANERGSVPGQRELREFTIGIIADTFTTEGLRPEVNLSELLPGTWREQLKQTPVDALFVESAWEGAHGQWRQKVGYYDEEKFQDLRELLEFCNQHSIPTIFWNKEDPIHFNRFARTAEFFDHVFTTDSDCLPRYARAEGQRSQTIGSLAFYAQPKLHNPLPTDYPYEHTVAYAGSYYGDRYPERSAELATLLSAAQSFGLTIYDRQYLNNESPYKFPDSVANFVRGGLPYLEMVKAYKAHPVNINVNSVDRSPTMFSRRVAEITASGSVVLSGKGEGVSRIMDGLVHTVSNPLEASILLERWMNDERLRLKDAWLTYRLIHRGHTAAHRLAYILRCAGLVVRAPQPPRYAVKVAEPTERVIRQLAAQTVRPTAVISPLKPDTDTLGMRFLAETEATAGALEDLGVSWVGILPTTEFDRTTFEDILTATTYGEWSEIGASDEGIDTSGCGLVSYAAAPEGAPVLVSVKDRETQPARRLLFRRPVALGSEPVRHDATTAPTRGSAKEIIVAGHDLKFAQGIIRALETKGHHVSIDRWHGHNQHDEARSKELLAKADIVFCEWTLGNTEWYSKNLMQHQRLVTRFHSQELFTVYPNRVDTSRLDNVIFVGKHIQNIAVRDHGIPPEKSTVIPNPVDCAGLDLNKTDDARFTLGMVGIVPAQKGVHRALDLLVLLRERDMRYRLRIKGKRPEEYSWMASRPEEMAYYDSQYQRIEEDPLLRGAVDFDGHGDDMVHWYQSIGVVLSLSEFESFHLTLADGAASGAVPAALAWPGADQIYPDNWLHPSVSEMAAYIRASTEASEVWRKNGSESRSWVAEHFSETRVVSTISAAILGDSGE